MDMTSFWEWPGFASDKLKAYDAAMCQGFLGTYSKRMWLSRWDWILDNTVTGKRSQSQCLNKRKSIVGGSNPQVGRCLWPLLYLRWRDLLAHSLHSARRFWVWGLTFSSNSISSTSQNSCWTFWALTLSNSWNGSTYSNTTLVYGHITLKRLISSHRYHTKSYRTWAPQSIFINWRPLN